MGWSHPTDMTEVSKEFENVLANGVYCKGVPMKVQ